MASLDQDRILRSFLGADPGDAAHQLLPAWTPTGEPKSYVVVQARPAPGARPARSRGRAFEIWVYSPRVEGVHLRFGPVARGGLRWSDRREDFRTEILGLVKAQMVKNAVIVPVGAKGGFVVKRPPADPTRPRGGAGRGHRLLPHVHLRAARRHRQPRRRRRRQRRRAAAAGRAARRRRPLPRRRRRQGHRDVLRHRQRASRSTTASGSATRSPPAARSATTTRRWASPPAARGSRSSGTSASSGVDTQTEDFTVVGVGDMSGDVFGNGMLLSEHIRLVAAFDHRHVFLDPDPDAGDVVRRAAPAVRPAALVVGRLRPVADLRGRRRLPADGEVDRRSRAQVRAAARPARGRPVDDPGRADAGDPARAGRPALERRHRHLRQGRAPRPTPTSATRPTTRSGSTAPSCGRGSSARAATSA